LFKKGKNSNINKKNNNGRGVLDFLSKMVSFLNLSARFGVEGFFVWGPPDSFFPSLFRVFPNNGKCFFPHPFLSSSLSFL
jgi:hypothetical protein